MQAKWITCVPFVAMILPTLKKSKAKVLTPGFYIFGLSRRQLRRQCDAVVAASEPKHTCTLPIITFFRQICCYLCIVAGKSVAQVKSTTSDYACLYIIIIFIFIIIL